jgi:hypothetical protein
MPKSPDEHEYRPELPENNEKKPQREIFKETARSQLDSLGYSILLNQLNNFFKGKDAATDLDKLLPHMFGNDNDFLNHMVEMLRRLPNNDEARQLLTTALFGEPAKRNDDGTIVITSFSLAEPSTKTLRTKFLMFGNKRDDKYFAPNIKGTDKLVRKLISNTGFQPEGDTAETISRLKNGENISLAHPSNKNLSMQIERPINSGISNSRTAYSYKVQTKFEPS